MVLTASVYAAALQYLVPTIQTATALDTHTGAATTWNNPPNDGSLLINIGFSFPFNGTTYTQVRITTNGMLNFGGSYTSGSNSALPNTNSNAYQSLYPYWDNLDPNALLALGGNGSIKYETLGSGNSQRLIVTYTDIPKCALYLLGACITSGGNYSFQVVLHKSGNIRFRYPSGGNSANGSSATIGVQESTTYYAQYSYNTTSIDFTKDLLYLYKPILAVAKTSCVIHDPVNNTTNPKRIPGGTIRYAIQISNTSGGYSSDLFASNVFATDTVDSSAFDTGTINYLQIQDGACNCTGVSSASNNGSSGSANGVNPVILDYGTFLGGTLDTYAQKCGYFEVDIK